MSAEEVSKIAVALRHWSRVPSAETALELREQVRRLRAPGQEFEDPAESAVQKARGVVAGKGIDKTYRNAAASAKYLAPFLGAEECGAASYHDPLTIDDEPALFWLKYLRDHRVVVDKRMLGFVEEMFGVRPRRLWITAAEAFVAMALNDSAAKRLLLDLCAEFGPPAQHPVKETARASGGVVTERARHLRRHVRYAAACWSACGGDPQELPPGLQALPAAQLPTDPTELSIEVLCLSARLTSVADRPQLLPRVAEVVAAAPTDYVVEEALRQLAHVFGTIDGPEVASSREEVERRLLEPGWLPDGDGATVDLVLSWLDSVSAAARSDVAERLGAQYPMVAPLLTMSFSPLAFADPIPALLDRLQTIFDRDVFATTPPLQRLLHIVETLTLCNHPTISQMPWKPLLWRALGAKAQRVPITDGCAAVVAEPDLISWLVDVSKETDGSDVPVYLPLYLVRNNPLADEAIFRLSGCQDQRVARQVAVQTERRLRELHRDRNGQVRFLWQILQNDPPKRLFTELPKDLRGRATTLHHLVAAVGKMDEVKGSDTTGPADLHVDPSLCIERVNALAPLYAELTAAVQAHVVGSAGSVTDEPKTQVAVQIARLSESFVGLAGSLRRCEKRVTADLLNALRHTIVGDGHGEGLAAWIEWVDGGRRVDADLSALFVPVESILRYLLEQEEAATIARCDEAAGTIDRLESGLAGCPWPEREMVKQSLAVVRAWLNVRRRQLEDQLRFAERIDHWLEARDAESMVEKVRDSLNELDVLPTDKLERVHETLLGAGKHEQAEMLRNHQPEPRRANLKTLIEHYLDHRQVDNVVEEAKKRTVEDIGELRGTLQSRVHDFLLERMYLSEAARFRRKARGYAEARSGQAMVRLQSVPEYLAPLFVGVLAGPLILMGMGLSWNEVLLPGHEVEFSAILAVSFLVALVTLTIGAARVTAGDVVSTTSRAARMAASVTAVLPVFVAALGAAVLSSAVVIGCLENTSVTIVSSPNGAMPLPFLKQLLLWSALSVFFGLFLGLVAQGKGPYKSRASEQGAEEND
jgi:hypothetical protein